MSGAVDKLRGVLAELDQKTGELAELKKAELEAERDGFHGQTVTEARQNAKFAAMPHTVEIIDVQADIDVLLRWRDYYTLLIERGLE